MGDIAEQLIEEEMFGNNEKPFIKSKHYKRTQAEKKIASIRKEIEKNIRNIRRRCAH